MKLTTLKNRQFTFKIIFVLLKSEHPIVSHAGKLIPARISFWWRAEKSTELSVTRTISPLFNSRRARKLRFIKPMELFWTCVSTCFWEIPRQHMSRFCFLSSILSMTGQSFFSLSLLYTVMRHLWKRKPPNVFKHRYSFIFKLKKLQTTFFLMARKAICYGKTFSTEYLFIYMFSSFDVGLSLH